jgi:hypothetical protein
MSCLPFSGEIQLVFDIWILSSLHSVDRGGNLYVYGYLTKIWGKACCGYFGMRKGTTNTIIVAKVVGLCLNSIHTPARCL